MISESKKIPGKKIGVIGLGNMGKGIAKNLIKAGNNVYVWDLEKEATKPFEKIAIILKPDEMSKICAIIIFVVPGSIEIDKMLKGKNSILSNN